MLQLEALEDRLLPAVFVWVGGYNNNNFTTAQNWQGGVAPGPLDDVVYDGTVSNTDCIFTGNGRSQMANSITMQNGYSGKLDLQQTYPLNIGAGGITQSSGDIEQDSGQPINDSGDYNFSGGALNPNSPFLADFNLQAGGKLNQTGKETSGSNLKLTNNAVATMTDPAGAITFTKGAGISIDATSKFTWVDGQILVANGQPIGSIENAGLITIPPGVIGSVTDALPIHNSGKFQLQSGIITITNKDANGHAYSQTAGTTDMSAGTTFKITAGNFYVHGGNFWTEGNATIQGDALFDAGNINLQHGDQKATALLSISGDCQIIGTAAWVCKVDCTAGNLKADTIDAKTMTLGGNSTFTAQAINVPMGGVPAKGSWLFLSVAAGNKINGAFKTTNLAFNDGSGKSWTIVPSPNGQAWFLDS